MATFNPASVMIFFLVVFISFFIAVALYYSSTPKPSSPDPNSFTSKYDRFVYWGKSTPVSGDRGDCRKYRFPTSQSPDQYPCSVVTAYPGISAQPSLNVNTLDSLLPINSGVCTEIDEIIARKVTRECQGVSTNTSAVCIGSDGKKYRVGETETIYTTDVCNASPCSSELIYIGIGYSVQPEAAVCNFIKCLTIDNSNTVNGEYCSMSTSAQFKMTRFTLLGKIDPKGPVIRLQERTTNMCLTANTARTGLVLSSCGSPNWLLISELKGSTYTSPQQIGYIGDLNIFELLDIYNSTSIDEVIIKISTYNVPTIQLDNANNVVLSPYYFYTISTPPTQEVIRKATSQYIDYTIYNAILFSQTRYAF